MYQVRHVWIVQYGQFREYAALVKQLAEVCEAKGWVKPRFLMATAGPENEAVLAFEYPDLATFEAESRAQMTDPEFMRPWRESARLIYPQSGRTQIFEDAIDIA